MEKTEETKEKEEAVVAETVEEKKEEPPGGPSAFDEAFDENPSSPEKPKEKPVEEKKETVDSGKQEDGKEKKAVKEKGEDSFNWDAESNPHLKKAKDFEKRLIDTRNYSTRVNQENKQLKDQLSLQAKQLEIINQKLDGTYEEPEELAPDPKEIEERARFQGKLNASESLALQQFQKQFGKEGKERLRQLVTAPNSLYNQLEKQNPLYRQRVLNSSSPVHEALKIVQEESFFRKYGRDPRAIMANMRKEMEGDSKQKLTNEITENLRKKQEMDSVNGLDNAPAATGTKNKGRPVTGFEKAFPD